MSDEIRDRLREFKSYLNDDAKHWESKVYYEPSTMHGYDLALDNVQEKFDALFGALDHGFTDYSDPAWDRRSE